MYKKSPAQKRSCYKMTPKSPMLRALVGNQSNLPEKVQGYIKAAPARKKGCGCPGKCNCKPSMARNYKKGYYGA